MLPVGMEFVDNQSQTVTIIKHWIDINLIFYIHNKYGEVNIYGELNTAKYITYENFTLR